VAEASHQRSAGRISLAMISTCSGW
jgi:hypothetical protein